MYPKDVPYLVSDQSNQKSLDNSYDYLKNFWLALSGGKKRVVKPGPNIKSDKTNKNWYLSCEAYQTLVSRDIKTKRRSLLNYSHCYA